MSKRRLYGGYPCPYRACAPGSKEARDTLVEKNIGLVHSIVRRFLNRGVEAEDLFQIGSIGLLKAIDKFDTSYDVKFSTYAVPVITGEIKRFLRDDGMMKVSRSLKGISLQSLHSQRGTDDGERERAGRWMRLRSVLQ